MEGDSMIVTRHISLDNDCIENMQPYIERHKGNFSAAIREIIGIAKEYNSFTNFHAIDGSLFKWMLTEIDGVLLPDSILDKLIDPALINSMENLEKYLKNSFLDLRWDVDIALKYDSNSFPSELIIDVRGNSQKIKFVSRIICQYLIKNLPESSSLRIKSINNIGNFIIIELSKANKSDAQESLITFFGEMDKTIKAIKNKPQFWKAVIGSHLLSNYSMVTIHRNYFEDLLANKIPMGEIIIETMARRPIKEIPLDDMLCLIKDVYEASRIVDRVEIDEDSIILFHNYRNNDVVDKLKKSLIMLLGVNGHSYDAKSTPNMIVLTHTPDIDTKLNQFVSVCK